MARASERGSRRRSKKTRVRIDLTGVETSGRSIGDGWAHGVIKKAEIKDAKSSDNEMIALQWTATRKKEKATVFDNLALTDSVYWKIKMLLEALGLENDGEIDVDCEELVGMECDIQIANEDYNDRDQPRVIEYRTTQELDKDAEEEEEPEEEEERPRKKVAKKSRDEDEEPEEEEEEAPRRKKVSKRKDEDEEPEEEEEERPRRRSKRDEDEDEDRGGKDEEPEEEEEEEERPRKKTTKPKIREGSKVVFNDEKDRETRGVVKSIDGDVFVVKTSKGEEYEIERRDLELA